MRQSSRSHHWDEEFSDLMAARGDHLYRSALLLTGSPAAAEDLTQATWVRTFVAWRKVRAADDPVAYVHRILINTFRSERRRRSSTELPVASPTDHGTAVPDLSTQVVLLETLAALAPLDRAVVVLRYWEDRSLRQTAHDLDLTEAAVKNRSLRALRTLRTHLDPTTTGDPS